jgi:transcriptional regulator with XRE-family HTH domain
MNPLISARSARNQSQQDLALITGFSRQMIQRYEAGRSNTPPVELCAYYDEANELPLGTTATQYVDWINSRRARLPLSELKNVLLSNQVPKVAIRKLREAIEDNCDVRPELGHAPSLSDDYFLSATMHVHPYSLQKWQISGNPPTVILNIVNNKEEKGE